MSCGLRHAVARSSVTVTENRFGTKCWLARKPRYSKSSEVKSPRNCPEGFCPLFPFGASQSTSLIRSFAGRLLAGVAGGVCSFVTNVGPTLSGGARPKALGLGFMGVIATVKVATVTPLNSKVWLSVSSRLPRSRRRPSHLRRSSSTLHL